MTDTPDIDALVTVRPGAIERDLWALMIWAAQQPRRKVGAADPPYWDRGNSDAEVKCRETAARILAAIEPGPGVLALVEALRPFTACVFNDNGDVTIDTGHLTRVDWLKMCAAAKALAALAPKPGAGT